MQAVVEVTLPFFALVLCGWLGARQRVLPESAIPGLNAYLLYFALPCMLWRFGASVPLATLLDPALIGVYAASAVVVVGFTIAVTFGPRGSRGVDLRDAAFGALVAAFQNSGFMGVPLLAQLMGDAAAGQVIGTLLVDFIFTSTLCVALASAGRGAAAGGESALQLVARPLRAALSNPLPWSIAAGAAAGASGLALPAWAASIVGMLADSATPVALFTIGAVLWRAGQHAHRRTPVGRYLPVALVKLVVHPLVVAALGYGARALGAPVSPVGLTVLILAAALPSASNVSLLAERYGADDGRVARIIMASTVLAFASFTALAWLLGASAGRSP